MAMHKYVLIDMNTQHDFLDPRGAVPVTNREALLRNLRKIFALSRTYHLPIISAVDSHREDEAPHDGFPRHCVEGTPGEKKLSFTLLQKRLFVEANNSLDLPKNLWKSNRQIVFRRRTADFLDNPKADRLLSRLRPASLILFGVGLERSIRRLALCLLARGFQVAFVPDACGYWNETEGDLARRLIIAKGGTEIHLDDLEDTFRNAVRPRITRIYSKAIDPTGRRRNIAG